MSHDASAQRRATTRSPAVVPHKPQERTKRVLNKEAVVTLFKEEKVPLNFDEFLASRADFDLDSTDSMCNRMMGRARVCTHVNHVVSSQWLLCMHAQPTSRRPLDAGTGEHIVTTWRSTFLNNHRRFNVG
jgi:hypothetical protein